MAFSSNDLAALDAAIRSGTKRVTYGDRTVEYHSMNEMLQLRDRMRAEIDASARGPAPAFGQFVRGSGW